MREVKRRRNSLRTKTSFSPNHYEFEKQIEPFDIIQEKLEDQEEDSLASAFLGKPISTPFVDRREVTKQIIFAFFF
jgi:hypothetical protein